VFSDFYSMGLIADIREEIICIAVFCFVWQKYFLPM